MSEKFVTMMICVSLRHPKATTFSFADVDRTPECVVTSGYCRLFSGRIQPLVWKITRAAPSLCSAALFAAHTDHRLRFCAGDNTSNPTEPTAAEPSPLRLCAEREREQENTQSRTFPTWRAVSHQQVRLEVWLRLTIGEPADTVTGTWSLLLEKASRKKISSPWDKSFCFDYITKFTYAFSRIDFLNWGYTNP